MKKPGMLLVLTLILSGMGCSLIGAGYKSLVDPGCDWISMNGSTLTEGQYQQFREQFGKPVSVTVSGSNRIERYRKGYTEVTLMVADESRVVQSCEKK